MSMTSRSAEKASQSSSNHRSISHGVEISLSGEGSRFIDVLIVIIAVARDLAAGNTGGKSWASCEWGQIENIQGSHRHWHLSASPGANVLEAEKSGHKTRSSPIPSLSPIGLQEEILLSGWAGGTCQCHGRKTFNEIPQDLFPYAIRSRAKV